MAVIQLIFLLIFASTASATDLKDATLQQLVESRPDLVEQIKEGKDEGTRTIAVTKDKEGRMSRFVEEHKDIDGALVGKRVHTYTYYADKADITNSGNIPITEKLGRREVTLPMYPDISEVQIDHVVQAMWDFLKD